MDGFVARPGTPNGAAIIVIQEAFGVDQHIQDVCQRFANEGYLAIAPQLFHRLGKDVRFGYDELPKIMPLFGKLTNEEFEMDIRAALAAARAEPGIEPNRVGVIGFCVGGFAAFVAACRTDANAIVSMYGSGVVRERPNITLMPLLPEAASITAPLLLLYGLKDQSIPQADVEAIRARLSELGKTFEIVVYPDAGHAFFNDRRVQYHEPSAKEAWPKALAWFDHHLS